MDKNQSYRKLLRKMLIIENAGEIFYASLIKKTKEKNLKLVYKKLALNEHNAAKRITEEISTIDKNCHVSVNRTILGLVRIICATLTERQLGRILKSILKRRIYSKWHNIHNDKNRDFWCQLLDHEGLQQELLKTAWNNQKKEGE